MDPIKLIAFLLVLIWIPVIVLSESDFRLLLTDKFRISSNSTCAGSCSSPAQNSTGAIIDEVLSTWWWESKDNDTPVLLNLSSTVKLTGFSLSIILTFQNNSLPQLIGIYSQSSQKLYDVNCSSCNELIITQQLDGVQDVHLLVNNISGNGFDIVLNGFQNSLHYEIQEITIYGTINEGYYLPGLHSVLAEAENGNLINIGFNDTMFPNFSGQGYVSLRSNDTLQLMLNITHPTSLNDLFLHYINTGSENISLSALVTQDLISCNVSFTCNVCVENCFSRGISKCNDSFNAGEITITVQASGNDFLLDYISAVPNAFTETLNMCDDIGNLNMTCTLLALQESLDLYLSLQSCDCSLDFSNNSVCQIYDGQCQCNTNGGQVGRQCTDCLYTFYLDDTSGKCIDCGCPDEKSCSSDGQCPCGPGVEGLKCDTCMQGLYGTPPNCQNIIIPPPPIPFPPPSNCSANTTGEFCDTCAEGYYNSSMNSELNCPKCPCEEPNSNKSCYLVDMKPVCFCNTGFTGTLCGSCDFGFYGPNCRRCDCGVGAINATCDYATGQCFCNINVEGLQCDECIKYHHIITNSGCIECDNCVNSLRQRTVSFEAELATIDNITSMARDFQAADTLDLQALQSTVNRLHSTCNMTLVNITKDQRNFVDIPDAVNDIQINITTLRNLISTLINHARSALPNAELVFNNIRDFHNSLKDTVEVDNTMSFVEDLQAWINKLANDSDLVFSSITSLVNGLLQEPLTNRSTEEIQQRIQIISNNLTFLLNQLINESADIATGMVNANLLNTQLIELQGNVATLFATLENINTSSLRDQYNMLSDKTNTIAIIINQSLISINQSDINFDNAEAILLTIHSDIRNLQNTLTDNMMIFSGSGGGHINYQQSIPELITLLNTNVQNLMERFNESIILYYNAFEHVNDTVMQEQVVCSVINTSLYAGNMAVGAIMNYTFVGDTLTLATKLISQTNTTLINVLRELDLLMNDELDANVTQASQNAVRLTSFVHDLNTKIFDLKEWYDTLAGRANEASDNLDLLTEAADSLMEQYYYFKANLTKASRLILFVLSEASDSINTANSTYTHMLATYSGLMKNVSELTLELNELAINNTVITNNAIIANDTALNAQENFQEQLHYLNMINSEQTQLMTEINTAKNDIVNLQQQLVEAQEAAALVDIALMFHGNSTSSYNLSHSTHEDTHISLYFRADSYTGTLLTDKRSNSLQLANGQVKWTSGDQELMTNGFNLQLNQWYQVEASNDNASLFLSVAPLQEPGESTTTLTLPANSSVSPINSFIVLAGNDDLYYSGCIDRVIVNGEVLPLLLPNITTANITACGPRPAAEISRAVDSSAWFQGKSRLSLPPIYFTDGSFSFSFNFRTFSQTSQLAVILNSLMMQSIFVYINDSVVHLQVSLGNDSLTLSSTTSVNDGAWHTAIVSVEGSVATLTVDQEVVVSTLGLFVQNLSSPFNFTLGGVSNINIPSFSGCLANVSIENANVDLSVSEVVERVEISQCPSFVSPGTRFMGTGLATFSMANFVSSLSFSFRTEHLSSVLLTLSSNGMLPDRLIVSLFHTYVRVEMINSFNDIVITSSKMNLNDGQWHDISISLIQDRIVLSVDGMTNDALIMNNTNFLLIKGDISVGGLPENWSIHELITNNYRGCFNNLYINGEYYDFNNAVLSNGVALYGCHESISMGSGSGFSSLALYPSSTMSTEISSTLSFYTDLTTDLLPSKTDILPTLSESSDEHQPSSTVFYSIVFTPEPSSSTIFSLGPSSTPFEPTLSSTVFEPLPSSTVPELDPSSTVVDFSQPSTSQPSTSQPSTSQLSTIFEHTPSSSVLTQSSMLETISPSISSVTESSSVVYSSSSLDEPYQSSTELVSSPIPSSTPIMSPVGLNGQQGSFLSYMTSDITFFFTVTLTFRTGSSNALLLYSQDNTLVDYMALELRNGDLYYSFNLGGGAIFINPTLPLNRYDDNMNHTVTISRNGTRGSLIIDGIEYSGSSVNSHTQLNTNRNPLYVGGIPSLSNFNLLGDNSQVPPGALACFYYLTVNGEVINLRTPSAANGMVSCQDNYNDYVSFPGSGYARLVDNYRPLVAYGFRLDFRTIHCTGLLLYSSSLYLDDHTALEINGGKIRFIFDNGQGAAIVEYIPANISSLCDGNWHHIQATKNGVIGTLTVDEQPPITNTLPTTWFTSVDTYSPLYAGGVPDDVLVRYTVTSEFFQGCLNNVQLVDSNQGHIISDVHFADVFVSPNVEVNTCHF